MFLDGALITRQLRLGLTETERDLHSRPVCSLLVLLSSLANCVRDVELQLKPVPRLVSCINTCGLRTRNLTVQHPVLDCSS